MKLFMDQGSQLSQSFLPEKIIKSLCLYHDRAEIRKTHRTCRFANRKIPNKQWHLAMRTYVKNKLRQPFASCEETDIEQTAKSDRDSEAGDYRLSFTCVFV